MALKLLWTFWAYSSQKNKIELLSKSQKQNWSYRRYEFINKTYLVRQYHPPLEQILIVLPHNIQMSKIWLLVLTLKIYSYAKSKITLFSWMARGIQIILATSLITYFTFFMKLAFQKWVNGFVNDSNFYMTPAF